MRQVLLLVAAVLGVVGGAAALAASGQQAAKEFGCTGCHAAQTQLVGPPLAKVAEKYNGDSDKILEAIKEVTKNGSQGKWTELTGGMSMPPQPQAVGKTEKLKAIADWIAGLGESTPGRSQAGAVSRKVQDKAKDLPTQPPESLASGKSVTRSVQATTRLPQGNPEVGKQIAVKTPSDSNGIVACKNCHGPSGRGQPQAGVPQLSGLSAVYQFKQLQDFATGVRTNSSIMARIAKALSEQQMWDVAAYYAEQRASVSQSEASTPLLELGERIAERGLSKRGVPACTSSCHTYQGRGIPPVFPRIGGQHASYLRKQLHDWAIGARANDPYGMMRSFADKLTDKEIRAVATYLSGAPAQQRQQAK